MFNRHLRCFVYCCTCVVGICSVWALLSCRFGRTYSVKYLIKDAVKYLSSPGLTREAEERSQWRGLVACYARCCPFLFLESLRSPELPATTEGESSRGDSPQGHKAGTPMGKETYARGCSLFVFLRLWPMTWRGKLCGGKVGLCQNEHGPTPSGACESKWARRVSVQIGWICFALRARPITLVQLQNCLNELDLGGLRHCLFGLSSVARGASVPSCWLSSCSHGASLPMTNISAFWGFLPMVLTESRHLPVRFRKRSSFLAFHSAGVESRRGSGPSHSRGLQQRPQTLSLAPYHSWPSG